MTVTATYGTYIGRMALSAIVLSMILSAYPADARDRRCGSTVNDGTTTTYINEGDPLAQPVRMNDICSAGWQDALPATLSGRYDAAIAITQDILLAGPPYTAYSPLGGITGNPSSLPRYAVKSNLLYAAGTLTPNLAVEFGLSGKASLVISGSYNPWNRMGSESNNDKLAHWVIRPEYRYWLCERFNGHFFGANPFFTQYNVSGKKIPLVDFRKEYRYEGYAVGAGVNYGYQFLLGKRWGLELAIGVGAAYMNYEVYDCELCGERIERKEKWYVGPTHAAINLVFLIK